MKKTILIIVAIVFSILAGSYFLDPNRMHTQEMLLEKGKQSGKDYMLTSLNVTSFARDKRELMWIGTSAGINVFDGKEYIQFYHDTKDTTALPDDYINVLHLDRAGRMWVGTENGLARYVGAYRFHRIALPEAGSNIVAIENASRKKGDDIAEDDSLAVLVSNGKKTYLINAQEKVMESKRKIVANNLKEPLPADASLIRKPKDIVVASYRDLGDNLWLGFRNAGYQVLSQNRIAYKYANDNPLAQTTQGKDVISLERVGHHILAGTTLRLYVYDEAKRRLTETYYKHLFDSVPAPEKLTVNNLVSYDGSRAWLVGNHQILSCELKNDKPQVVAKASSVKISSGKASMANASSRISSSLMGYGVKNGDALYVSCENGHLLRFHFGAMQPEEIPIKSKWYDEETQLTTLHNGDIFLFMKNMHCALFSPKTGTWQELKLTGIPDYANIDPAFVRQDSYGSIWLGTKRYGLYHLNMAKHHIKRINTLNDVHIQAFLEDGKHQLWVTTMRDAFCLQPKMRTLVMNSLVSASQDPNAWQFFDNAICLSPAGNVVFGSSDGCKFLSPPSMNANFMSTYAGQHAGRVLGIYSLEVDMDDGRELVINDRLANGSRYTFAYDENDLRFRFFYPNYSRRSAMMYQYMLEGYDKTWRTPTYQHEALFSNLSPGKYTFRLRLVSAPDLPPLQERTIEVIIKPAPWNAAAAWFLYICIVGYLVYYINWLYLKERTNRLRLLEEQREHEREKRTKEMNMSFFANISHEFRNPITIIAGPLMALNNDASLPEKVHHTLNHVCMSVNRMLRLIDQMLDFNQLETDALRLKVSEVDAAEELHRLVDAFEESTKVKGIRLELDLTPDTDYHVWLDVDKLEKIMSNLFTNALKHTAPQGTIRITARMKEDSQSANAGKMLDITVFNNGNHIADDKLEDVFKRYYQLAETQSDHHYGWGTGIGLYYVKRLVGLHHGEIEVKNVFASEEEASDGNVKLDGVEFHFALPAQRSIYNKVEIVEHEERVMQISIPSISSVSSDENKISDDKKPKILVVDDDVDVAQYIRSIFCDDYEIVNRYSAEEALADLEGVKPDIILSDVIMGKMSGYEFCKTLKNDLTFSHIPVILITAKSNMDEQIGGLRMGAVAYVTKPFDPAYLKALVESQLQNMITLRKRLGESMETDDLSASVADSLSEQDRKFMDELYSLMEKRSAEMELNVATVCHDLLISQSKFNSVW